MRRLYLILAISLAVVSVIGKENDTAQGVPAQTFEAVELGEVQRRVNGEEEKDLEALLHWAIENSDHDTLKRLAAEAGEEDGGQGAGLPQGGKELEETRERIKALYKQMNSGPSEADLIQDALTTLRQHAVPAADAGGSSTAAGSSSVGSSVSGAGGVGQEQQGAREGGKEEVGDEELQELMDALEALAVLVEPIDNANDMAKMGGTRLLYALLEDPTHQPRVRAAAAHALGVAASNDLGLVARLLEDCPGLVELLVELAEPSPAGSTGGRPHARQELQGKALYLLGKLLRASQPARRSFYSAGGTATLVRLLDGHGNGASGGNGDGGGQWHAARRKALSLAGDLPLFDPAVAAAEGAPRVVAALGRVLISDDLDLVDKALQALRHWLGLTPAPSSRRGQEEEEEVGSKGEGSAGGGEGEGGDSRAGREDAQGGATTAEEGYAANALALRTSEGLSHLSSAQLWLRMQRQLAQAGGDGDEEGGEYVAEVEALLAEVWAAVNPSRPVRPQEGSHEAFVAEEQQRQQQEQRVRSEEALPDALRDEL